MKLARSSAFTDVAVHAGTRMLGCLYSGHWPFPLPYGYTRTSDKGRKYVIKCEPHFSLVSEAFHGFANRSLENQAAVRDFLADQAAYRAHHGNAKVTVERAYRLLTNVLYSGYLEYPKWGVPRQKAIHEGAVSLETFEEVQRIITVGRRPSFVSRGADFPARGLVICADCNGHLTSGWSSGKLKKYAYYNCFNRSCESYGKSIPRTEIEDGISSLLHGLKPTKGALEVFSSFGLEAAEARQSASSHRRQELRSEIASNQKKERQLIDKVLEVTEKKIVERLQERVVELGRERELLLLKLKITEDDRDVRREHFEHLGKILAKSW